MQKLGAVDANFLYTETERMPNHIASVQRFELPAGVTPTQWVESLRDYVMARRHRVDYLHRKLQFVPGNFDHPLWVEAGDLDMTRHIVEVPLPAPGSTAQMERVIADIHSRRMDRTRPLWSMHVITGLDNGDVAIYNQIHHAAIDGLAGQAATMQLMDTTPDHEPVEAVSLDVEASGLDRQLQRSFDNLINYQLGNTRRMLGNFDVMRRLLQRAIDPSRFFGAFGKPAPDTRFNRAVGRDRVYAGCEVDFSDIRSMSKQVDCTVNDAFMAICAGGLRRYLLRQDELPATSLIAGCPVSLRQPDDDKSGNQVTMMTVELATHIDDPKVRLLSIHESARIAKEVTADLAGAYDGETSLFGLPALTEAAAAASERSGIADLIQMPINVVLSNVPGPRDELFFNGARMKTHYPVSIAAHGTALNITVQSYGRHFFFGITACRKALPDAQLLRDDLLAAFRELKQALLPATNVAPLNSPKLAPAVDCEAMPQGRDESEAITTRVA